MPIYVNYKPSLWCLLLHQAAWIYQEDDPTIHNCPYCKKYFWYPTKKEHRPVYQ